jgi:hypothetical protein
MATILYYEVKKMKEKFNLRKLRGEKTLEQVARETGIPYSTIRSLEVGVGNNFHSAIKHRLSDYYGVNFLDAFPEEGEKFLCAMSKGYHLLTVIEDWFPGLNLTGEEKMIWTKTLQIANLDEIDFLNSGETEENVRVKMKGLIKKYRTDK